MTDFDAAITAFRDRLSGVGLTRHADALVELARPGVRLVIDQTVPVRDRSSRLGGVPDLPPGSAWPHQGGVPLSFIAQVNLADVSGLDSDGLLPADGLLAFFYEAGTQMSWGFDPADRGSAAVIHTPAGAPTETPRPPAGLPAEASFPAVPLRPTIELSFAAGESFDVEQLGMTRDEAAAYAELVEEESGAVHRLLGHPDPVQGDMQLECQLVTHGLNCGSPAGYQDPLAAEIRAGAADWRLLLQVDSQDEAQMMWGDAGRLYYWMRTPDLIARDWDRAWLILQCC